MEAFGDPLAKVMVASPDRMLLRRFSTYLENRRNDWGRSAARYLVELAIFFCSYNFCAWDESMSFAM